MFSLHEWKCDECGSTERELHLHHKFYLPNREPWQYEDHYFSVLCSDCHKKQHEKPSILYSLIDTILYNELTDEQIRDLIISPIAGSYVDGTENIRIIIKP
jgi:hypothetical protein